MEERLIYFIEYLIRNIHNIRSDEMVKELNWLIEQLKNNLEEK